MTAVSIKNLSKTYKNKTVVHNITFHIPEHSIYGLIGVNGAGKTTIMKLILGLVKETEGEIHIFNEKMTYGHTDLNKSIGFLADVPQFYNYMTAKEYLKLCGEISDMGDSRQKSCELLEQVGLKDDKVKIGNFSLGMKKRLGLAQALLNSPKLLICDEPTSALDPLGRKEMLDLLTLLKSTTTILFSTHILSDIENVCDNLAIVDRGNLLFNGTMNELNNTYGIEILCVEFNSLEEQEVFLQLNEFEYEQKGLDIYFKNANLQSIQRELYQSSIKSNIFPKKIEIRKSSLENILIEVTK